MVPVRAPLVTTTYRAPQEAFDPVRGPDEQELVFRGKGVDARVDFVPQVTGAQATASDVISSAVLRQSLFLDRATRQVHAQDGASLIALQTASYRAD